MDNDGSTARRHDGTTKHGSGFAVLVAAGILLSRIAGLIRERVFAHFFGNSLAAGAFKASLRIPNLLQNLFGEGVLSASFIPVYARLIAEKKDDVAGRVAGAVAAFLFLTTSVIVLIGVLLTPYIIDLVAPGFTGEARDLTIRIVRILFPGVGLLVLSAWCLGILNSHRKFFLSYVAPVLWNVAMIAAMVIFAALNQNSLAIALSWGTVIGSALQFGVQLPFVFRYAPKMRFVLDLALENVRQVFRNMGPVLMGRGVVQLSAYIDGMIASYLGTAAVAALGYAQTIYLLPISLFGMSVAAAELPQMSSATGTPEEIHAKLRARLESGLRQIAFFVVPTVIAFLIIGDRLVGALYQTGQFGHDDTLIVWYILIGSTIGLLAATLGRLYNSAFYALHDTKTPLKYAAIRMVLTAVLGLLFAFPLRPYVIAVLTTLLHLPLPKEANALMTLGAVGLTASAGIAGWVEFLLLRHSMRNRVGKAQLEVSFQLRLWGAAVAAGVVAKLFDLYLVTRISNHLPRFLSMHHVVDAILVAGVFGVVYFAVAIAAGVPEAQKTIRRFVRK